MKRNRCSRGYIFHDLVLIFPTWSCLSCYKLLQSHLPGHFHYLIGITLVLIWLLYVLYLVVGLSFNPFLILEIHCNRRQETLSMPKYSLKLQIWNSIGECNHCFHQWERHSVECWQRHESIWHGTIRLLFRECSSPLRTRSSFKRFLYCGSKVLGVVQSTHEMFCVEVRNRM